MKFYDPPPEEVKEWVMPGCYIDKHDAWHLSVPSLVRELGREPTEENCREAYKALKEVLREMYPGVSIEEDEYPEEWRVHQQ